MAPVVLPFRPHGFRPGGGGSRGSGSPSRGQAAERHREKVVPGGVHRERRQAEPAQDGALSHVGVLDAGARHANDGLPEDAAMDLHPVRADDVASGFVDPSRVPQGQPDEPERDEEPQAPAPSKAQTGNQHSVAAMRAGRDRPLITAVEIQPPMVSARTNRGSSCLGTPSATEDSSFPSGGPSPGV